MTTWREVYDSMGINFEDRKPSFCTLDAYQRARKPATPAAPAPVRGITPCEASRQSYIAAHGKQPPTTRVSFTRVNTDDQEWHAKAQREIERMRSMFTSSGYREDLRRVLEDFKHGQDSLARELQANCDLNALYINTIDKSKLRTFAGGHVK